MLQRIRCLLHVGHVALKLERAALHRGHALAELCRRAWLGPGSYDRVDGAGARFVVGQHGSILTEHARGGGAKLTP